MFRRLMDEFGLTQETLARRVGKSQPAINQMLRLLDHPPARKTGRLKVACEAADRAEGLPTHHSA